MAATPIFPDRSNKTASIHRTRTDPRPNSRRRRATICLRSAVIITIGKRGGRWERQPQPQNASRAPPTLGIQKTITTLYPQLPLRRTVATSKHTPLLNLEARVGQAHVKSTCESRATIHPSLLRGIFRGQRDRTDTNQPTLRSASPSHTYAMRGVVPVRRDVVFVHHAWTIPDALALRASGQIPSFAHRLLAPLQVGLKIRSQNHFNMGKSGVPWTMASYSIMMPKEFLFLGGS